MASLSGATEWHGGPCGSVPAAVALGQVTPRVLILPEAATYFYYQRRKEKRTWLSQSLSHQPPSTEDGLEKEWTGSRGASC